MIYLNKLAAAVLNPLTIALILLLLSLLPKQLWLRISALILLFLSSNPLVANFLIGSLEKQYERVVISDLPNMDVLVVLSGMVNRIQTAEGSIDFEFNDAVDRINVGIEIMKSGQSGKLILTRGLLPWSQGIPEGEFLRKFAVYNGIPQEKIKLTNIVENTEQEFLELRNILDKDDVIGLITSAFHMQRALMHMSKIENDVVIIPVDYRSTSERFAFVDLLPNSEALYKTSLFFKEQLGILQLKLFGFKEL